MALVDVIDLSSDDELEQLDVKPIKLAPILKENAIQLANHQSFEIMSSSQWIQDNRSINALRIDRCNTSTMDQGKSLGDNTRYSPVPVGTRTGASPTVSVSPAPLCRQFWKAGSYNDVLGSKDNRRNGTNYLHVHPEFLHSNATSHKWAFGAIAELLDNAIDEIENGATFITVDKITNPKDGSSALLFQDNGGGMSPEAMQRCMSFGFTDKSAKSAIGRYGNGFKTSTMRLGADVVVFSRHWDGKVLTQSIGLLSYTFLSKTGYDRIVVPMVHYKFNASTKQLDFLHGKEHFMSNLSLILKWSPYSTEQELLKQFDDFGSHGTKVIIYNLWYNDDGVEELDYNTDPKDIRISGDIKKPDTRLAWTEVNEKHIGYRYRYSLRVYLSILYLRVPKNFKIILRGEVVEHHNLADDLKYQEYILYQPQNGSGMKTKVITTIGFLKDAPQVNIHGFNVYHKNRLILPYWQVVNFLDSRGRGVVGILEANFVEPTHNKQDFEKTLLFQRLEGRLKDMTWEYWDLHCGMLGYQVKKKITPQKTIPQIAATQAPTALNPNNNIFSPVCLTNATDQRSEQPLSSTQSRDQQQGLHLKRKEKGNATLDIERAKRQAVTVSNGTTIAGQRLASQVVNTTGDPLKDQEAVTLKLENQKLHKQFLDYQMQEEELNTKVTRLENEIKEFKSKYAELWKELQALDITKQEKPA